ncbi:MAG TPA: hypothetical protein VEF71_17665, partial [Streptosporangiaceae bacterium]|nr:hypothetical protein [Streptosporangiaceae bacterium]
AQVGRTPRRWDTRRRGHAGPRPARAITAARQHHTAIARPGAHGTRQARQATLWHPLRTTAEGVQRWLDRFGDAPFDYEVRDLEVAVGGDVAYAHGLTRMGSGSAFSM